jgi:K+-sensing histidine kinase KdpD
VSDQAAAREAADADASGAVAAAGHFRIYLGAAAGIGTTVNIQHLESIADEAGDRRSSGKLRELTADVGARWHDVQGDDPARAIAAFAQEHQITQIVIGSSQRSRWQQLTGGGSNVTRVMARKPFLR